MQLALSFPVHSPILCLHLVYKHFFSFFPEVFILAVNFFYYWYTHVTNTVAPLVKVCSCCFCKMFVCYISSVFREPLLQAPFRFTYILFWALLTTYAVYHISGLTGNCSVYINRVITCCWFNTATRLDKWTNWTYQGLLF